jgi:ankyrin repeat protein
MNPFKAVAAGDADALQAALDKDPSLAGAANDDGVSLVRWALYHGRRDLADAVLAHDPPLDVFDAAAVGRTERLSQVVHHDRSLASARSSDGFTPLHLAAFLGTPACAAVLLRVGADPAAVSSGAMTVQPLHSAAAAGNVDTARLLLDAGAPVDPTQAGGFTPLHEAARRGDEPLVDLLLDRGADRTVTTDAGRTAAELAAEAGHQDLADRLR